MISFNHQAHIFFGIIYISKLVTAMFCVRGGFSPLLRQPIDQIQRTDAVVGVDEIAIHGQYEFL